MHFNTKTIDHHGVPFHMPFVVKKATSVYLYSLFNYEVAYSLCENESFKPIVLQAQTGEQKAGGFLSVINNEETSLVSYLEWSLGIFVIPNSKEVPEVELVNETSLLFQSILDNKLIGDVCYCPKLYLTESLPTEIGFEYYGMPKELGEVIYNHSHDNSGFSVSTKDGSQIMKAAFPTKRGIWAKFNLLGAMFKAHGFSPVLKSLSKKEFSATSVGSSGILAKKAYMKIKKDQKTQMFPWEEKDCKLEINPENKWGHVLKNLQVEPQLVCHIPKMEYEFSEPLDQ